MTSINMDFNQTHLSPILTPTPTNFTNPGSSNSTSTHSIQEDKTFQIFIGGIDPKMDESSIISFMSKFGEVTSVALKKRHNNPALNLGHGILSTSSRALYDFLIEKRFVTIGKTRLECREYFSSDEIARIKERNAVRTVVISGFPTTIKMKEFRTMFSQAGLKYENIIMIKRHKDNSFTGMLKVILKNAKIASELYGYIQKGNVENFPACGEYELLAQKESSILQSKRDKKEHKAKTKQRAKEKREKKLQEKA